MDTLLSIETSGPICSIAVSKGRQLLALQEMQGDRVHGEFVIPLIQAALQSSGLDIKDMDAVAVSAGPGSFTGLRVGMATAKGLCTALHIPLIVVPTLAAIATGMHQLEPGFSNYIPVISARSGESFAAVYNHQGDEVIEPFTWLWHASDANPFDGLSGTHVWGGPGIQDVNFLLPNQHLQTPMLLSAEWVQLAAFEYAQQQRFADLITAEPIYIKPVRITQPKNI